MSSGSLYYKRDDGVLVPIGSGGGSGGGGGFTFSQDDPPTATKIGDTWYHTATGNSFVWTSDGNSLQWVQFAPGAGSAGGGEGGSGFTFVQDTTPTPLAVGDTWFDLSTAASGGTSWVAVEEGAAGSELVWVQFAPGQAAGLTPYYCILYGVTGNPPIPVNTGMAVPWVNERNRRGLTRTGGAIYCPDAAAGGLYSVTATVNWWPATSWPPYAAPGFYQVWVSVNRARTICQQTGTWDQSTGNTVGNCAGQTVLAAGDYVEAWVRAEPTAHGPYIYNGGEFQVSRLSGI